MKPTLSESIINNIGAKVQNNELDNIDLLIIIESCGRFLNLKTISEYAKYSSLDYNSVKARIKSGALESCEIFGVKFVVEND